MYYVCIHFACPKKSPVNSETLPLNKQFPVISPFEPKIKIRCTSIKIKRFVFKIAIPVEKIYSELASENNNSICGDNI